MRIKLFLFLPREQAKQLVEEGFPDSNKCYRLNPAEYTACSAFNPKSLVEIVLELAPAAIAHYRRELELPMEDEFAGDDEFGASAVEPIYWYEFPASELRKSCRSVRVVTGGRE